MLDPNITRKAVVTVIALLMAAAVCVFVYRTFIRPYRKKEYFFTKSEARFFRLLQSLLGARYYIFGQVRIADVIEVHSGLRGQWQTAALNRIAGKHFDYLVCDRQLHILAAIELDDSSHLRWIRRKRDRFVNRLCRIAGLPLIHVTTRDAKDREQVRKLLAPLLT